MRSREGTQEKTKLLFEFGSSFSTASPFVKSRTRLLITYISTQFNLCQQLKYSNMAQQQHALPPQLTRSKGVCKKWDSSKGYGFITVNDGSGDVFAHYSELKAFGFKSLAEGESVEFRIVVQPDGRRKAVDVTGPFGTNVKGQKRPQAAQPNDDQYGDYVCGFSPDDVNELLCQGVKPWDSDAGAVMDVLNGAYD